TSVPAERMPAVDVAHSLVLDGSACARDQGSGRHERGEGPSRTPSPRFRGARPLRAVVGGGQKKGHARSATLEGGGGRRAGYSTFSSSLATVRALRWCWVRVDPARWNISTVPV